jgi:hypothetical protein
MAEIAAVVIVAAAVKVGNAVNVVSVRKETDHKVETVAPVGKGHRVHKASVRHVHKVSVVGVRHVNRARKVSVQRVRKVNVHHVHRLSNPHQLRRHSCLRLQRFNQFLRFLRRRRRQRHQHRRLGRLRASRGDSKPCYWHRHVQSTADSIAVV